MRINQSSNQRTNNRSKSKPDQRAAALANLFPVQAGQREIAGLKMIDRDRIIPKKQVRREALKGLVGLGENISELKQRNLGIEGTGVLQALTVTPATEADMMEALGEVCEGYFRLVYGHRRYYSTENILHELPCITVVSNEQAIYLTQGIENVQREDLSPLDEAAFVYTLREQFKLSIRDTAAILGKHRRWVENRVKLHKASYKNPETMEGPTDIHDFLSLHGDSPGATNTNMRLVDTITEPRLRRRLLQAAKDGATEKALIAIINAHNGKSTPGSSSSKSGGTTGALSTTTTYGQSSTPAGETITPGDSGITIGRSDSSADPILNALQPAVAQFAAGVVALRDLSLTPDYRKRVRREIDLVRQQADLAEKIIEGKSE